MKNTETQGGDVKSIPPVTKNVASKAVSREPDKSYFNPLYALETYFIALVESYRGKE